MGRRLDPPVPRKAGGNRMSNLLSSRLQFSTTYERTENRNLAEARLQGASA